MKKLFLAASLLAISSSFATAQSSTWTSDPAHSEVDFSVKHLSISNVHGRFGNVNATIVLNEADIAKSTVTATIDVSTADTGMAQRDTHIKSPDFFDVATYSTASFTSTGVAKNGSGLAVSGNFTLHGVTKPIVLQVEAPGAPIDSPMDHKQHRGFEATATISRTAFGIGPKFPDAIVSDAVKLTIEIEAVKQ
jgi:polyisoprenoid-binding protein YceI